MLRDELAGLLRKLRPVAGDVTDALWLAALLDPNRERDIHSVVQALAAQLVGESYTKEHILLEPPEPRHMGGQYPLGWITYAGRTFARFGLHDNELPQHVAILGRSGAGKSNVGYLLAWNLLRAGKPFMVLDWRRNYNHLARRPEGRDMLILPVGEPETVSFNPLEAPAGLTANQRDAYLRDIVSEIITTYLPGHHLLSSRGVEYLWLKAIAELPGPLTFNDIQAYIGERGARSREADWKASSDNVLLKLTTGPIGRVLNGDGGYRFGDLLNRPVILELDALGSQTDRAAFTKSFLVWLFYHRLCEGRTAASKHVLFVEEAHQCFHRRHEGEQTVPDLMMRQMRDLGQAIVLLDQTPSLLSTPAVANVGSICCLALRHANDLDAAAKALALLDEQRHYIGRLGVGEAIVKVPRGQSKPFLVRFPPFPVAEPEEASCAQNSGGATSSVARAVEETRLVLSEAIRAFRETDWREKETVRMSTEERGLLVDIAQRPLAGVTERYERLGWTAHKGTKAKRSLLDRGLAEEERIRVPEGVVVLLKLTEDGRELLEEEGMATKAMPRNAGLVHEYWKRRTAEEHRRRGYHVEEEVPIGDGRAIDLVATKGDERIAIEVETGKSDGESNVRKCREAGFHDVRVVAI